MTERPCVEHEWWQMPAIDANGSSLGTVEWCVVCGATRQPEPTGAEVPR